jgi:hypothetical protein
MNENGGISRACSLRYVVAAAVLSLLPFSGLLIPDGRVIEDNPYCDYESYQLPVRAFARNELLQGRLPLWIPYIGCGMPLHAGQQGSLCYPLLMPLVILLGANAGIKASLFIHLVLGYVGQWLLSRRVGISGAASSMSGALYVLGGFCVYHLAVGHVTIVLQYALVPWCFLALSAALAAPSSLAAACIASVVALCALAGQPQILYYALVFGGLWAGGSLLCGNGRAHRGQVVRLFLLAGVLAVCTAAAQLVPAVELVRDAMPSSERGGIAYANAFALDARDLPRLFWPSLNGNPFRHITAFDRTDFFHERVAYLGAIIPVLAIYGLTRANAVRWQYGLAGLVMLGFLIALGESTVAFRAMGRLLPGLFLFRCPGRVFSVLSSFILLLAGRGLDQFLHRSPGHTGIRRTTGRIVGLLLVNAVFAISAPAVGKVDWSTYVHYASRHLRGELASAAALLSTAIAGGFVVRRLGLPRVGISYAAVLGFCIADTTYHNASGFRLSAPRSASLLPQSFAPLRDDGRLAELTREGHVPAGSLRYSRLVPFAIGERARLIATNEGGVIPASLMRLHGAIEVDASVPLALAACRWTRCGSSRWLTRTVALPRLRVIDASLSQLLQRSIETLTERDIAMMASHVTRPRVIEDSPMRVVAEAYSAGGAYLVIADTAYTGWSCLVDGRHVPYAKAHGVFRAVRLPAGQHRVEWRFTSRSFALGCVLSVIGLVLLAAVVTSGLRRYRAP